MTGEARGGVIVGLSFGYHDSAAAVVVDGQVVAAAEEERFSRVKHDRSVPRAALAACLDVAGVDAGEVDEVVFYEKPLLLLARYLATRQRQGPAGMRQFVAEMPMLLRQNLGLGYSVGRMFRDLGVRRPPPLRFVEHHRSHASAAFYPSPFDTAAVLTVDGIGEWATATLAHGTGNRITVLEELRFPDSLGLLYSLVTVWCGFEPNDGEYKVMGLAPYGEPRYLDGIERIARRDPDGGLGVDGRRVRWFAESARRDAGLAELLGGPPRPADVSLGQRELDLAASIQAFTEEALLSMAQRLHELTGEEQLCLAGGVALNCVGNGRLRREGPFRDVWVQPAAGDSGSAIGAALTHWHDARRSPRPPRHGRDAMGGSLLGPGITTADAVAAFDALGVAHEVVSSSDELVQRVAERLDDGAVVGWVQGRMEFGPRALGNRSILADPRDPHVRSRLNALVKGRESFRPFAPAVLEEHVGDWFEPGTISPYMLNVEQVRSDRLVDVEHEPAAVDDRASVVRSQIPACTHIDGSARVQTISREVNPRFWSLVDAFGRRTGCPVLVNTSFNRRNEPIVRTPADAWRCFVGTDLDVLVLEDCVLRRADLADRLASA